MTDRKLLAEYKLWARDGWAARDKRRTPAALAVPKPTMTQENKSNKPTSALPKQKLTTVRTKAPLMVAKLNLSGWIDDDWAAPSGVKRPRKLVARMNIPRPPALKKIKATATRKEPKKRRKHGAPSMWDAVPPEPQSESEDDEAAPEPVTNYASLHTEPNTLMYQGLKTRVQWHDLFDFLSSKGWHMEKLHVFNGAEATVYFPPKGKLKDEGGKLGRDYFLSHEGVLQYLAEHQDVLQDFFY